VPFSAPAVTNRLRGDPRPGRGGRAGRLWRGAWAWRAGFASRIEGRRIRAVERRGKYLLVRLASGDTLLMHLGMSGSFRVARATRGRAVATEGRHDHVVFELSNGAIVVFNDPRRFGVMDVIGADAHPRKEPECRHYGKNSAQDQKEIAEH
jgi:formamidopyrimidine-DNA glycosylase